MVLVVLELSSHLKAQEHRETDTNNLLIVAQVSWTSDTNCKRLSCCSTQDGKIGSRCSDSGARETQDGCGYGDKKMQNASKRHCLIAPTTFFSSTCLNGGTCRSGNCQCRGGYAGNYCQVATRQSPQKVVSNTL